MKTFIQETLRRSRTSYSTLQVALYYLISIKHRVPKLDFTMEQPDDSASARALQCGRRMFLAALILASKYLQDRNYSSRAWSKMSGLGAQEINANEMTFLAAINWRLHLSETVFQRWANLILKHSSSTTPAPWATLSLTSIPSSCASAPSRPARTTMAAITTTPATSTGSLLTPPSSCMSTSTCSPASFLPSDSSISSIDRFASASWEPGDAGLL